jgi:pimeloyl-ACP methyl ester carboxylesterase
MHDSDLLDHLHAAADAANLADVEVVLPAQTDLQLEDCMRLRILDWGGPGATPVVLLHGGGLTAHTWDLLCLTLRPGYRCIAPDLRGHGDSAWSPERRYRLEDHRGDLEGLVAEFGLDRFVLVGMSLGGAVAMTYAGRHADKLSALVLVDVGPEMSGAGGHRLRAFAADSAELDSVDAYVERARAFNPRRRPELLRRSLLHNLRQTPTGKWAWKYDPNRWLPPGADPGRAHDVMWANVERITCPTLVVRGAQSDMFLASDAEKLLEHLPDGHLVSIEGAGHTVQGDQPRQLAAAIGHFLGVLAPLQRPLEASNL